MALGVVAGGFLRGHRQWVRSADGGVPVSDQGTSRTLLGRRAADRLRRAKGQPGRWVRQREDAEAGRRGHAMQVIREAGGGDLPSGMLLLELGVRETMDRIGAVVNRRFEAIAEAIENGEHRA